MIELAADQPVQWHRKIGGLEQCLKRELRVSGEKTRQVGRSGQMGVGQKERPSQSGAEGRHLNNILLKKVFCLDVGQHEFQTQHEQTRRRVGEYVDKRLLGVIQGHITEDTA